MKTVIGIFTLLIIVILVALLSRNVFKQNVFPLFPGQNAKATLTLQGKKFSLLVAKTEKDREIGLSKTNPLPQDQGMVFIFDKPDYYAFWMRNMKYPLDIIFLNNKIVITEYQNIPNPAFPTDNLPVYKPDQVTDIVIELNAGTIKKYNIQKGDKLDLNL